MVRELKPLEFLEKLQKEYMLKSFGEIVDYDEYYQNDDYLNFLNNTYNFSYDKNSLNEDMKKMRAKNMISKYENPYYYGFLSNILVDIHKVKDNFLSCEELPLPIIGTIEFELFTAQVRLPKSNMPPIIIFSSGIIHFAHIITNLLAKVIPIEIREQTQVWIDMDIEKILTNVHENKWFEQRFVDLCMCILLTRNPRLCSLDQPQDNRIFRMLSNRLSDAFMTFIVAHECAHHYLGHLNMCEQADIVKINQMEYEKIKLNWEQEYDADYLGALLTLPVLFEKKYEPIQIISGIYISLWSINIIECLQTMSENRISFTHPSGKKRLIELKNKLKKILKTDLTVLDIYDKLFSTLWDKFIITYQNIEKQVLEGEKQRLISYEKIKELIYQ